MKPGPLDMRMDTTQGMSAAQWLKVAKEEDDYASHNFLQWFVDEQVEEVDSMTTLLDTINHSGGIMLLVEDFVRRFMVLNAQGAGGAAE